MHHLAILNPKYHYLDKILSGEKSIESRWYKFKIAPWNKIKAEDRIFFKDSGKLVQVQAQVAKVLQFDHQNKSQLLDIISKYGNQITANDLNIDSFYESIQNRNYVILIFLKNPQRVTPFKINKSGFGSACAWISIDNINQIKAKS